MNSFLTKKHFMHNSHVASVLEVRGKYGENMTNECSLLTIGGPKRDQQLCKKCLPAFEV